MFVISSENLMYFEKALGFHVEIYSLNVLYVTMLHVWGQKFNPMSISSEMINNVFSPLNKNLNTVNRVWMRNWISELLHLKHRNELVKYYSDGWCLWKMLCMGNIYEKKIHLWKWGFFSLIQFPLRSIC